MSQSKETPMSTIQSCPTKFQQLFLRTILPTIIEEEQMLINQMLNIEIDDSDYDSDESSSTIDVESKLQSIQLLRSSLEHKFMSMRISAYTKKKHILSELVSKKSRIQAQSSFFSGFTLGDDEKELIEDLSSKVSHATLNIKNVSSNIDKISERLEKILNEKIPDKSVTEEVMKAFASMNSDISEKKPNMFNTLLTNVLDIFNDITSGVEDIILLFFLLLFSFYYKSINKMVLTTVISLIIGRLSFKHITIFSEFIHKIYDILGSSVSPQIGESDVNYFTTIVSQMITGYVAFFTGKSVPVNIIDKMGKYQGMKTGINSAMTDALSLFQDLYQWVRENIMDIPGMKFFIPDNPLYEKYLEETNRIFDDYKRGVFMVTLINSSVIEFYLDRGRVLLGELVKSKHLENIYRLIEKNHNAMISISETFFRIDPSLERVKQEPTVLMLVGGSGMGKTMLINDFVTAIGNQKLPDHLLPAFKANPVDFMYRKQAGNVYDDGYNIHKFFTVFDDFMQYRDQVGNLDAEVVRLFDYTSVMPSQMHMANINQKGNVYFKSEMIIGTTNITDMKSELLAYEPALKRRIHLMFMVIPKPEYRKDKCNTEDNYLNFEFDNDKLKDIYETVEGKDIHFKERTKEMLEFVEFDPVTQTYGSILSFDEVTQRCCEGIDRRRAFKQNSIKQLRKTALEYEKYPDYNPYASEPSILEELKVRQQMGDSDYQDTTNTSDMSEHNFNENVPDHIFGSDGLEVQEEDLKFFDGLGDADFDDPEIDDIDWFVSPETRKTYKMFVDKDWFNEMNIRAIAELLYVWPGMSCKTNVNFQTCDLQMLGLCLIRDLKKQAYFVAQMSPFARHEYFVVGKRHKNFVYPKIGANFKKPIFVRIKDFVYAPYRKILDLASSFSEFIAKWISQLGPTSVFILELLIGTAIGSTVGFAINRTAKLTYNTIRSYYQNESERQFNAFARLYDEKKWFTIINKTYNPWEKPTKTNAWLQSLADKQIIVPEFYLNYDIREKYINEYKVNSSDYAVGWFYPQKDDPPIYNWDAWFARMLLSGPRIHFRFNDKTSNFCFMEMKSHFEMLYQEQMKEHGIEIHTDDASGDIWWDFTYAQSGTHGRASKRPIRKLVRAKNFSSQMGVDKNGKDIMIKILNNQYEISYDSTKYTDEQFKNMGRNFVFVTDDHGNPIKEDGAYVPKTLRWTKCGYITGICDTIFMVNAHFVEKFAEDIDDHPSEYSGNRMIRLSKKDKAHIYMNVDTFLAGCKAFDINEDDYDYNPCELLKYDSVLVQLPRNLVPSQKNITEYFVTDETYCKFRNAIPSVLTHINASENNIVEHHFDSFAMTTELPVGDQSLPGSFIISRGFEYKARTINGDCGSLLIYMNPQLAKQKILGFHSAGNDKDKGFSSKISYEDVMNDLRLFDILVKEEQDLSDPVSCQMGLPNQIYTGKVNDNPFKPLNTKIIKTNLAALYEGEEHKFFYPTKEPAQLMRRGNVDPMKIAQEDIVNDRVYLDPKLVSLAVESCRSYLFHHSEFVPEYPSVWTFEEALHGIPDSPDCKGLPSSSGSGYPMSNNSSTNWKKIYFNPTSNHYQKAKAKRMLKELSEEHERLMLNHIRPYIVNRDCLKDEPLRKGKNTRMFSSGPFVYQINLKKYFGSFIAWITKNKISNGFATGMNVFSEEWHELAMKLGSYDHLRQAMVFAGDFKKFDISQLACIMWGIFDIIEAFYDKFYNDDAGTKLIRKFLFLEIVQSRHLYEENLVMWYGGNPSGNLLTLIINGFYNQLAHRICWIKLSLPIVDFNDNVYIIVEGDDSVVTVSHAYRLTFNEIAMCDTMPLIGLKYTSETKTRSEFPFRSLHDIGFCKRSFVYDKTRGRYIAPLEMNTINHIPCFNKQDSYYDDRIVSNVENCIRELSLHPKNVYDSRKKDLLDSIAYNYRGMIFPRILDIPHDQCRDRTLKAEPVDMWL